MAALAGGCVCGAVRYACDAEPLVAYACHCARCRKVTSSYFHVSVRVPSGALRVVQGTPRRFAHVAESGRQVERHFCGDCGSTLYYRNTTRPEVSALAGGSLDAPPPLEAHIWVRSALPGWPPEDGLPRFETHLDPRLERWPGGDGGSPERR